MKPWDKQEATPVPELPVHVASRRAVLQGIGSLSVTALLGGSMATGAQRPQRRIDTHHHFFPPELKQAQRDSVSKTAARSWTVDVALGWTVEKTLEDMEQGAFCQDSLPYKQPEGTRCRTLALSSSRYSWQRSRYRRSHNTPAAASTIRQAPTA